jgi:glycosyltransferase 2 family protein
VRSRVSVLGLVVSVVCVGGVVWWATKQDAPKLPHSPRDLLTLASAVGIYAISTMMRAERWQRLLVHDGASPHRTDSYALTAIGYAVNNILPARAGDAVRIVLMAPAAHTTRRTVLGTLLAERLLDIVVVVLLFLVVGYGLLHEAGGSALEVIGIVVGALLLGAATIVLALRIKPHLRDFVRPILSSTLNLRGRHGVFMLLLTVGIWVVETLTWMTVAASLDFNMSLLEGLYLVALASVFALIPSGPAYAGTQDSAVVIGTKAIGGTSSLALSYVLMLRFALVLPITITGLAFLAVRYGGLSRLRRTRLDAVDAATT